MAKTAEQKAAEVAAKKIAQEEADRAAAIAAGTLDPANPEPTEEELKAESDRVAANLAKKEEERNAARASNPANERTYSTAEVQAMLKQLATNMKKDAEEDEEDAFKHKKVRLSRFKEKFIIGLKNMNTDEYFPDQVIHAFDIWDDKTRQNVAYVCLQFIDGTELNVPLFTALTKSKPVVCDLIETLEDDISYSDGKTERAETRDYSRVGTGTMVKMKVTQAKYTYKIKLPDGQEIVVGPEVLNW